MIALLLIAVCAPFSAQELNGDLDAAFARRMDEWRAYIANYKPDYSDSSAYLQPPTDNRLERPFAVVRDGRPAAAIILDASSREDRVLRQAAEELQTHVKLITGVELPIRYDSIRIPEENSILLGKRLLPGPKSPWFVDGIWRERLSTTGGNGEKDGFAIRLDPDNPHHLHVFGLLSKGTMNGVFALLENNTDIIWARPDEKIGTIFTPSPGKLDFVWGKDYVTAPATRARGWICSPANVPWASRNRCNLFCGGGGGDIGRFNDVKGRYGVWRQRHVYGHTMHFFMRGCDDPDIRQRDSHGGFIPEPKGWGNNPCFTSPKTLDVFVSNLVSCAQMAPTGTDQIYPAIEDSWNLCRCERCLAPIELADGTLLTKDAENFRSTQFWMFFNLASERFSREVPGMKLVNLAYFFTAAPPACEIRPDVVPEFAPFVRSNDKTPIFAPENAVWMKRLAGWGKLSKDIETFDYHGIGMEFPRPLSETRAWDFTVMHPFVVGMESCVRDESTAANREVWDISAMEPWVEARLYWDPSQDVEKLRKYFIRRTYREAAPAVEKVYGIIRQEWFKSPRGSLLSDDDTDSAKLLIVSKGHATEISNLLDVAVATAVHPNSKELAGRLRRQLMKLIGKAMSLKTPKTQFPLVRVESDPDFDDAVWRQAVCLDPFVTIKDGGKTPAKKPVTVRAFHDSDNIRLNVHCADPDIATLYRPDQPEDGREKFVKGDHLEFLFGDPLSEGNYYLFSVSPDDITVDWAKTGGQSWNGEWRHRARRTDVGWDVLLTLPLKTIHADNPQGNNLKMLIIRETHPDFDSSSSWGGGGWHQFTTFGDVRIMR